MNQYEKEITFWESYAENSVKTLNQAGFFISLLGCVFFMIAITHRATDFIVLGYETTGFGSVFGCFALLIQLLFRIRSPSFWKFSVYLKVLVIVIGLGIVAIWLGYF